MGFSDMAGILRALPCRGNPQSISISRQINKPTDRQARFLLSDSCILANLLHHNGDACPLVHHLLFKISRRTGTVPLQIFIRKLKETLIYPAK